jgi:hypothetical protein
LGGSGSSEERDRPRHAGDHLRSHPNQK